MEYCLSPPSPPEAGASESDVGAPVGEKILGSHSKSVPAKNIYTKLTNVTVSYRETCARTERVNLFDRQIMILPRKTKTYAMLKDRVKVILLMMIMKLWIVIPVLWNKLLLTPTQVWNGNAQQKKLNES